MSPLAVVTAILFGSAVAIAFGLNAVWVILFALRAESSEIGAELTNLSVFCVAFLILSALSGAAMYSLLKSLTWRWRAQWSMWTAMVLCGLLVWWRQ